MNSKLTGLVLTTVIMLAPAAASAIPSIGDTPPPLVVSEWVKGKPIDLKKDLGKRVFMLEFWATWCPPCKVTIPMLTKLQKKYEKDLTIVGLTALDDRGNTRRAIKRFVKKQGDDMSYTVAIDEGMSTWMRYMGEMAGIPHAFVIGRDGKIAWQGSPLEPSLDQVLGEVIRDEYDTEAAKRDIEVGRRFDEMNFRVQMQQWSVVWDLAVGILKIDPANGLAMEYLLGMYIDGRRSPETYRAWVKSHIAKHRNNAEVMQRLAIALCANPEVGMRTPALALEAGKAAYEARKGPGAMATAAYARSLYQIGMLDRAIRLQRDAVAAAPPEAKEELRRVLEFYRACKELQGSVE